MLLIVALAALIVIFAIVKIKTIIANLPPGPLPLPLLGNILQIDRTDPRKTFQKWRDTYGPVYTFWFGPVPNVFVCNYEFMHEMFVKHGEDYIDRAPNLIFEFILKGKYGILLANGEHWKEQRRFTLHVLRNFGVGRKIMEDKVMNETIKLLEMIETNLNNRQANTFSIENDLELCIGNIISSLLIGKTFSKLDPTFETLKRLFDRSFKLMVSFPVFLLQSFIWLRHVPLFNNFGYESIKEVNQGFLKILYDELEKHKEELRLSDNSAEPSDFTDAYLREIKRRNEAGEEAGTFSEWQLVCVMGDLWVAGLETTVTTLSWTFLFMMKYPEVQRMVQNEIDKVVGLERAPSMNDKQSMPYTQAVLNECQRFANIAPMIFGRIASKETRIGGYPIPEGTCVVPQISIANRERSAFAHPDEFDPSHFLEPDNVTLKKVDDFLPFSLGKRACLGEGLARMELFLIFTSVLQKFCLSHASDEPPITMEPVVRLTLMPKEYKCHVTKRF